MKTAIVLMLLCGIASAQPTWSENGGWNTNHNFDSQQQAVDEIAREHRRQFDETSKRMDDDFNRTGRNMFLLFGAIVVAMGIAAAIAAASKRRERLSWVEPVAFVPASYVVPPVSGNVDVSVLRIAIDGRASKFVQDELARVTKQFENTSPDGRSKLLRETGLVLRRVRDAWVYGGAVNEPLRVMGDAKQAFTRHVEDARTRFAAAKPPVAPNVRDARPLMLVSIIVAAHGELATVSDIGAGDDLRRALEAASHRDPSDFVALEIVWTQRDISSIDLEVAYPRPEVLPLQGALAGKIFCNHCHGPFPSELVSCPHCGAPAAA